jgi:spermidine synthase
VRASHLFQGNFGVATDSRLDGRLGDGRHELLRRAQLYDVIALEPPPPSAAGAARAIGPAPIGG